MKFPKRIMVCVFALVFSAQFSALAAREVVDEHLHAAARPLVEKVPDGFFVEAPAINNLVVMIVRVINDQGEQVVNTRSVGEPVELYSADLPDGEYHYEVKSIYELDTPVGQGPMRKTDGVVREAGSFYIEHNRIFQAEDPVNDQFDEELGFIEMMGDVALAALGNTLNLLISSANAADVDSTPNGVFRLEDDAPYFIIYHSNIIEDSSDREEWWRWLFYDLDVGGSDSQGLELRDAVSGNTVIDVQKGTGHNNAVQYFGNGDIRWGDGTMALDKSKDSLHIGALSGGAANLNLYSTRPSIYFHNDSDDHAAWIDAGDQRLNFFTTADGGSYWTRPLQIKTSAPTNSLFIDTSGQIGLGTNEPSKELHLSNNNSPTIRLQQNSELYEDQVWDIVANEIALKFADVSNFNNWPLYISTGAPSYSLDIRSNGNIGLGTAVPLTSLHVQRDDGTAQILVDEINDTAAPRTLFRLKNKGNTKFGVLNTEAGVEWAFANPGTGFRLSRQGSGVVEMEIFNNGNMNIAGALTQNSDVNSKTGITDIDPDEILSLVSELPVSQWEYKDAEGEKHIGPMAQDFYAAFGLGASETGLSTIDTSGVALVAIKALVEKNESLESAIEELRRENRALAARQQAKLDKVDQLEQMVKQLMQARKNSGVLTSIN